MAVASREEFTVSLMREALVSSSDRDAALVHFAETASPQEAAVLRQALSGDDGTGSTDPGRRS